PGVFGRLVRGAHLHPNLRRDHPRCMVLLDDHFEAVLQGRFEHGPRMRHRPRTLPSSPDSRGLATNFADRSRCTHDAAVKKAALALLAPLLLLNLAVAFFGRSAVFPLSPFHLSEKWDALRAYAMHRPRCLFRGHDDFGTAIAVAEKKHRLPRGLLAAVIEVESNREAHRISPA